MNAITSKITLDLMNPGKPPVIHAVQGENYSRCVELTLLCDGAPWQIPTNTLLTVRYGRADLSGGYYDTLPDNTLAYSYEGNTISMVLAPQMMQQAGSVFVQVEMHHEGQMLSTYSFQLMVAVNPAVGITGPETYINWLQWMENQLATHVQNMLEDGELKGPAGPKGEPAVVTGYDVAYQAGQSPTVMPDGTWSVTVPNVAAGQYLWTRTTIQFNSGSPVVSYSVTRFGMDGSGSVSSVAGISPDSGGNVPLTADSVGALPTTGGRMNGPINMNGQTLTGLNPPVEDSEAATKGFANSRCVRNLLDNSDFTNLVAQAGIMGNHGTTVYLADRWQITSNLISYDSTNRILTFAASNSPVMLRQVVSSNLSGKTVTLAIKASSVTGSVHLSDSGAESGHTDVRITDGITVHTFVGGESTAVLLWSRENASFCVDWITLYEGQYTAETLPEYQPKGYAAELLECQRYYVSFDNMTFRSTMSEEPVHNITITFPVTMRIVPTVSATAIEGEAPAANVCKNGIAYSAYGEKYTLRYVSASADL